MNKRKDVSKKNLDAIKDFWTRSAENHGTSHSASWSDRHCMELEFKALNNYIKDGDNVIDIGCASGHTSLKFALDKKINLKGIDYIDEMIINANKNLDKIKDTINSKVSFAVGNAMSTGEIDSHYDVAIFTRVLCNLYNQENIISAITESNRILKVGGVLLVSEPIIQSWERLNILRNEWGLESIGMPEQNFYLDEDILINSTKKLFQHIDTVNFSSSYFISTRVLKPIMSQAVGMVNNIVNPELEWNKISSLFPPVGDYGIQKLFVFQKT